jgi:integrase
MSLDLETYMLRASSIPSSSLSKKRSVLGRYGEFLGKTGREPGLESLQLWVDELTRDGMSPGSISTYAYDVLSYFDVMMMDLNERMMRGLKKRLPKRAIGEVDFLLEDEVDRLLRAPMPPEHRLVYSLMYTYARRIGEVLGLMRDDVDLEANTVTFNIEKKDHTERVTCKLDREPWLRDMLAGFMAPRGRVFKLKKRALEIAFKKVCRKAGINEEGRRLVPHILRHSRATHLRKRKVPLDVVSKSVLRHSNIQTTVAFYRGITEEEKAEIPSAGEIFRRNEK